MRMSDWRSDVCSSDLLEPSLNAVKNETLWLPIERRSSRSSRRVKMYIYHDSWETFVHPVLRRSFPQHRCSAMAVCTAGIERSEERRVGKECGSTCRYRGEP